MSPNAEAILRNVGAAVILYVAYFITGVVVEVLVYATAGFRESLPGFIPWRALFDAMQILLAVALMRLFASVYEPKVVLAIFTAFLGATLVALYGFTPEMADVPRMGGVAQVITAIAVCAALLFMRRF